MFLFVLAHAASLLDDYWISGVINSRILNVQVDEYTDNTRTTQTNQHAHTTQTMQTLLISSLSSYFVNNEVKVPEQDNFVQVKVPILIQGKRTKFERILFVSPQVVQLDREAVKETFIQLYCGLLGILLTDRDISRMRRSGSGTFFSAATVRSPSESLQKLLACLDEFERRMGVKLKVAMIDAGPDTLPSEFVAEFAGRQVALYRHPLNMVRNEVFYVKFQAFEEEPEAPQWAEHVKLARRPRPFRIMQRYTPTVSKEQLELEEAQREIEWHRFRATSEEYVKLRLEPIYGRFEEISLDEDEKQAVSKSNVSVSEIVRSANVSVNKGEDKLITEEDDFEIINKEDYY